MTTALCHISDLPDGQSRGFDVAGGGQDTVFLVRQGAQVYGWRNSCPHIEGAPMAWRKDAYLSSDRKFIVCYAHGAKFEIVSGICVSGPCLGQALTPVPLQFLPNGEIELATSPC